MPDLSKVLKIVPKTISIYASATPVTALVGGESFVDIGAVHDEAIMIKLPPISDREIGGGMVQKAHDASFETQAMQVKDIATLETNNKNKYCWIKLLSVDAETFYIKNVLLNIDAEINPHAKGKSFVKFSGTKYVTSTVQLWGTATTEANY